MRRRPRLIFPGGWPLIMGVCLVAVLGLFITLYIAAFGYLGISEIQHQARRHALLHNIELSVFSALITTGLCLAIGLPTAWWLKNPATRAQAALRRVADFPLLIPPGAIGVFLIGFFVSPPGRAISDITGLKFIHAQPGLVVGQFAVTIAFSVRLLVSVFEDIDSRYEQVARSLGAPPGRAFRRVVLPLALPGIVGATLLTWIRAVGEFDALMILTGGIRGVTDCLPVAVYLDYSTGNLDGAIFMSLLTVATAIVMLASFSLLRGKSRVW